MVAGGNDTPGQTLAGVELCDPAANTWTSAGALAAARYGHTATLMPNGKVLLVGGTQGYGWWYVPPSAAAALFTD